ncbi:tRNA(Ile)-lysidine synthase [Spiroplasma eriocheiris]|uniref:tRNA(Ile)-lysidine synthase n=2 Tax=Spiroplasma eriocheiris TaxID=315358 RepID=A0A0H3XH98_9MOLU|nr:PP-loop family protein [Spiroplasma eriocheiris CCTCC M 207170]AKM53620.1 tRNA(Ile)-lysidine synthase [Spiroplasma eriocheiris]
MNFDMLDKNQKYIIGVSGGPDSMFLLDNIYQNKEFDINNFIVGVVNYKKRSDSDIDQQIVVDYCIRHKIAYYVKEVSKDDYLKYQQVSHNFQTIARDIRYDFFIELAQEYACHAVLVAHNLTDNIETYILQKQRNNIVEHYGLSPDSIYYSKFSSTTIAIKRIMLDTRREFIIEYLNNNKINYALDYTNILGIYNRNVIRSELQDFNFADLLAEMKDQNYANEKLKQVGKDYLIDNFGQINVSSFRNITDLKLQKMIIFNYFKIAKLTSLIINKKRKFLDEVVKEISSPKPNIMIKINEEYFLVKSYENVEIKTKAQLALTTIIIKDAQQTYHWKNHIIIKSVKDNFNFFVTTEQLPLKITNDPAILKNVLLNGKQLTKIFIKEKINLLIRLNYVIIDKNNEIVAINDLLRAKLYKPSYLNEKCLLNEKYNFNEKEKFIIYFMIK